MWVGVREFPGEPGIRIGLSCPPRSTLDRIANLEKSKLNVTTTSWRRNSIPMIRVSVSDAWTILIGLKITITL